MRKGNDARLSNEVRNSKSNGNFETERKKYINIFLWIHIALFITIPVVFWTADTIILQVKDYKTFQELIDDTMYMNFLLVSLIVAVVINLYIVIVLSIC